MAGKMLVERTIFWPGRRGTDAPLRRRSGRGKTGGGSLATGGAGRRRERYSRERGQERMRVSPGRGGKPCGTLAGMGGLWPCFCPNHLAGDGRGVRRFWGRYERKAPQPQPRRRTARDGEGDSSHGTFPKRAAGRSCRRGKGTCGRRQRRREGSIPGPLRTVRAVGDKRSPAGIGSDAGGAPRSVTGYCGVSEGAQSGARSSKAV